jgi:presenilin-like A22 family membrane protease
MEKSGIIATVAIRCLGAMGTAVLMPGPPWLVLAAIGAIWSIGISAIIAVLLGP